MEQNREIDIDLKSIFYMLKRKAIYIVLIALVGGIIAGCYTNFFIQPKYTATATLCAYSDTNRIAHDGSITTSQIEASQQLVNTYIGILRSNTVLDKVAEKFDNSISASQISGMMSCSQVEGTFIFKVRITSSDRVQAMNIVNTIAEVCPDEIIKILNVGSVQVIDFAKEPTSPSSPNLKRNILVGFGAAFLVAFVYFFIKEALDTSIINESDLERVFTIPVLGTIPRLVPVDPEEAKKNNSGVPDSLQLKEVAPVAPPISNTKKGE